MNLKDVAALLKAIRDFRDDNGDPLLGVIDYYSIEEAEKVCIEKDARIAELEATLEEWRGLLERWRRTGTTTDLRLPLDMRDALAGAKEKPLRFEVAPDGEDKMQTIGEALKAKDTDECLVCGGDGGVYDYTCEACGGTGKQKEGA